MKPQLSKSWADVADETEEAEASSTSDVKPNSELKMDSLAMDESKSVYKTLSDPDDASIEAVRTFSLFLYKCLCLIASKFVCGSDLKARI